MALVSKSSFTFALLYPPVQVVIVIDGLRDDVGLACPNESFERVLDRLGLRRWRAPQVLGDGFSHDQRDRRATLPCPIPEVGPECLVEAEVRGDEARHGDIAIPRYRSNVDLPRARGAAAAAASTQLGGGRRAAGAIVGKGLGQWAP